MPAPSTKTIRTYESTSAPGVNDDTTQGFSRFDLWIETDTNICFMCMNPATGAAVWRQVSLPAIGTDGQVLKVVSGAPAYAADAT
jgi:hypothetical protein